MVWMSFGESENREVSDPEALADRIISTNNAARLNIVPRPKPLYMNVLS